jgi:GNAT superfamily N-acetyltransferase
MSRLLDLLHDAAFGRFPPADGTVEVFDETPGPAAAVLGFTAHFAVCAPVESAWVERQLPAGDLSAPMGARFIVALAERLGADIGANDAVLVALAREVDPAIHVEPAHGSEHSRAVRARRYRRDVRVWTTPEGEGMVLLGRGVAGRWEVSFEVDPSARGRSLGSVLARAALGLLPAGTPVFAQVTPGNAASVRSVLAAGYRPVGAEVLLPSRGSGEEHLRRGWG